MNATYHARLAYAPAHNQLRSARSTELQVFGDVTARLNAAETSGQFPNIAAALHDNRRLWARIAADVADADNGLPQELRARIFWLAEFSEQHSRQVLHHQAPLRPLIDINLAMMRGLDSSMQSSPAAGLAAQVST